MAPAPDTTEKGGERAEVPPAEDKKAKKKPANDDDDVIVIEDDAPCPAVEERIRVKNAIALAQGLADRGNALDAVASLDAIGDTLRCPETQSTLREARGPLIMRGRLVTESPCTIWEPGWRSRSDAVDMLLPALVESDAATRAVVSDVVFARFQTPWAESQANGVTPAARQEQTFRARFARLGLPAHAGQWTVVQTLGACSQMSTSRNSLFGDTGMLSFSCPGSYEVRTASGVVFATVPFNQQVMAVSPAVAVEQLRSSPFQMGVQRLATEIALRVVDDAEQRLCQTNR
jgi:hypothetical protein